MKVLRWIALQAVSIAGLFIIVDAGSSFPADWIDFIVNCFLIGVGLVVHHWAWDRL